MAKTIVVRVERRFPHPQFKKVVTAYKKFYAHDEKSEAKVGDRVRIEETRPLSKIKRWRLVEVVERSRGVAPRGGGIARIIYVTNSFPFGRGGQHRRQGAWAIGVLGRNQRYAHVGDIIKVHIKDAAPDGTVKKGEVHERGDCAHPAGRSAATTARICALTATRSSSLTRN